MLSFDGIGEEEGRERSMELYTYIYMYTCHKQYAIIRRNETQISRGENSRTFSCFRFVPFATVLCCAV